MGPGCGPMVLLLSFISSQALGVDVKVHVQPMVAFVEGKPAMKHTAKGWEAVEDTGYMTNKRAILKFCKSSYPDFDVRNIVEMNDAVTIDNWCSKGKKCQSEKVIPYKCLIGEFQSDALLVPEGCKFDHVHDKKKCQAHDVWKKIAAKKCATKGEELTRYGMLKPCNTDLFEGIEYVCCPQKGDEKVIETKVFSQPKVSKDLKEHMSRKRKQHMAMKKKDKQAFDAYQKYKHLGMKSKYNLEHQKFSQALESLEKKEHEKVTAVMKNWANARDRISAMKTTDPKGAARMEKEVTERFKKTYQALEQENHSAKNQLLALHEQHILANINEKKRKALDQLTKALGERKPDAEKVIKFMQRYIRAEGKDREHTIKHFAHTRNHKPANVEEVRQYTLKHLNQINDRINQSLQLVERMDDKRLVAKVQARVQAFMRKYNKAMDEKMTQKIVLQPVDDAKVVEQYREKMREDAKNEKIEAMKIDSNKIVEAKEDAVAQKKEKKPFKPVKPAQKTVVQKAPFTGNVDDETYEDEHLYMQPQHNSHNAAMKDTIALEQNELFISKENTPQKLSSVTSTTVGIVVGALVAVAVIVIAIVMVRRRSSRSPTDNGFIEVSQAVSPEERHVQTMQSNGYENPTYKFFEMQPQ